VIRRALYRVGQFFTALRAPLIQTDLGEARALLSPAQRALFERMAAPDRHHALAVYRTLQERGIQSEDLLVAALLHDVGKAESPPPIWVRVAVVLLEQFAPRLLAQISAGEPRGWRRLFVIYRQHAEIGAEWAAQAGCSPRTVDLIRRHHLPVSSPEGGADPLLAILQEVDRNT
jgi:putative nucleotidyltransferase with HDIG domain